MGEPNDVGGRVDAVDSDWLRERVAEATAVGIQRAVADPATWAAAAEGIHRHAKSEAGGFLLGGLRAVVSRVFWIAIAGIAIYTLGGWAALVSFFKAGAHAP